MSAGLIPDMNAAAYASTQLQPSDDEEIPPVILKNQDFAWVRGFNYQPGYSGDSGGYDYGTAWDIWRNLRLDIIERQLSRAVELYPKMTALRIWLPYNIWLAQPKKFMKDLTGYIGIIRKLKLRAMAMMFNAWHGTPDFGGFRRETFVALKPEQLKKTFAFADELLKRFGDDPTVFSWDLCNEPELPDIFEPYFVWLDNLYAHIKEKYPKSVLTVGVTDVPSLKRVEKISDVFGPRLYMIPESNNKADVSKYKKWTNNIFAYINSTGKPVINTETGWPRGDDGKARAEDGLRNELGWMNACGAGWLIHALYESPVADIHRSSDGPKGVGWMSCINKDGTIREGHEIINDFL